MTTFDVALWSVASVLFSAAAWITVRRDPSWDPAIYFAACWRSLRGEVPPLTEGPIPEGGWDGDLRDLPAGVHPSERLAHGLDWANLDGPEAGAARDRRLEGVKLVWIEHPLLGIDGLGTDVVDVGGWPPVHAAEGVPSATPPPPIEDAPSPTAGPHPADDPADVRWADAAAARILAVCDRPEERLVLAASSHATELLRVLRAAPALRDRVRAVLLVHPHLDASWVGTNVQHVDYDVEVQREVPWIFLRAPGSRLPDDPPEPPSARRSLALVDLGVVDAASFAETSLSRALGLLIAAV